MSLETIRKEKSSKFFYIVIGLVLLGMAGFGTSQYGQGGKSEAVVLSAGGSEITAKNLEDKIKEIKASYPDIPEDIAKSKAVSDLKISLAVKKFMSEHSFGVSKSKVESVIKNNQSFFLGGKFDKKVYKERVAYYGGMQGYEESLSEGMAGDDFASSLLKSAIVSEIEITPGIEIFNAKRDLSFFTLKRADFSHNATEPEITKYYKTNKENFKTEDKVSISYIDLGYRQLAKEENLTVSDTEIKAKYQSYVNKQKYLREVSYLIFKTESNAKLAYNFLAENNNDISKLKESMADKITGSETLELSQSGQFGVGDNLDNAIFALNNIGDISAPIKTEDGFFILKLDKQKEIVSAEVKSLADATNSIKDDLLKPKLDKLLKEKLEKLETLVFSSKKQETLESIAKEMNLPILKTGLITKSEGAKLIAEQAFNETIFGNTSPELNKLQEPIQLENGNRVVIYKVLDIKPSEIQPLKDIKEIIKKAASEENISTQITKLIKEITKEVKTNNFAQVAKSKGFDVLKIKDISAKTQPNETLGIISILGITKKAVRPSNEVEIISTANDDIIVYVSENIRLGSITEEQKKQTKQILSQLESGMGNAEYSAFLESLTERTSIKESLGN